MRFDAANFLATEGILRIDLPTPLTLSVVVTVPTMVTEEDFKEEEEEDNDEEDKDEKSHSTLTWFIAFIVAIRRLHYGG